MTFTGSTEVGRMFLRYSAVSNLKRVILECGGKSPQVVMADAGDLDLVAEDVLTAGYANMGENCTCGSRLIVHRSCTTSCCRDSSPARRSGRSVTRRTRRPGSVR